MLVRNTESLNKTINKFLKRNNLIDFNEKPAWQIKRSELGGFGVFSSRNIEPGELIFKDFPVILGPRAALTCPPVCVNCYKKENLQPCENNCGLPICSKNCQNSPLHQKECEIIKSWKNKKDDENNNIENKNFSVELLKCLTPIRSLLLNQEDKEVVVILKAHRGEHHGYEVNVLKDKLHLKFKENEETFMRYVCSVLDSNAFEVIVGEEEKQSTLRGLYPLGSLANHNCIPNTCHVFDEEQRMIVRAAVFIPENTEMFHSYTRFIWGTQVRRFHLFRTKHFLCKCPRCKDPSEFGTYMSAILCKKCKGKVIPLDPLKSRTNWQCEDCKDVISEKDVGRVTTLLGSALRSFADEEWERILKLLDAKLMNLVPESNQSVIELKYRIIWIFGYSAGVTWKELSEHLLMLKEKFCRDILSLLFKLGTGQCKMKGLLLYELFCTLKELDGRMKNTKNGCVTKTYKTEMEQLLHEASEILKYDVGAPIEIKQKWTEENHNSIE